MPPAGGWAAIAAGAGAGLGTRQGRGDGNITHRAGIAAVTVHPDRTLAYCESSCK
ncbi:hypothetical protein [Azospirillum melinis]